MPNPSMEFVTRYPDYISQLEAVVKPGHLPAIVKPEHYFNSEAAAVGVVFRRFAMQMKNCIFG